MADPEVAETVADIDSAETNEEEVAEPAVADDEQSPSRLEAIIESILFASGSNPVPLRQLVQILDGPSAKEIAAAVTHLRQWYAAGRRGMRLVEVAGGYQFRTAPENAEWVRALLREKPTRLGRATLETLAIIAYKQPVTRAEIEAIRGVDVDGALSSLLSKRLIKIAGRKETVGRPLLYVTSPEFLEVFGLKDLNELPTLKELPAGEPNNDTHESPPAAAEEAAASADAAAFAEAAQSGGGELTESRGGADSSGEGPHQRAGGDGAGDEGGPTQGPHHR
jgi:segregation and condensation protein B